MVGRVVVGMSSSLILSFYLHCGASLVVEGFLHLISIVKSVKGVRDIRGLHQNTQRRSRCEIPNARRKWTKRLNSKSSIHGASPDDLTTWGYLPHLYGIRRRVRVGFVWSCPRGIMIVISELSRLVGRGFEGLYLSRDSRNLLSSSDAFSNRGSGLLRVLLAITSRSNTRKSIELTSHV